MKKASVNDLLHPCTLPRDGYCCMYADQLQNTAIFHVTIYPGLPEFDTGPGYRGAPPPAYS